MAKKTTPREGWKNKHLDGVPSEPCNMMVEHHEMGEVVGTWEPTGNPEGKPLGTLYFTHCTFEGVYVVLGFNCWASNDSEFVYYKKL